MKIHIRVLEKRTGLFKRNIVILGFPERENIAGKKMIIDDLFFSDYREWQLFLDSTRIAHPMEYAEFLDRYMRCTSTYDFTLIDANGNEQPETAIIRRYGATIDGEERSREFIRDLKTVGRVR